MEKQLEQLTLQITVIQESKGFSKGLVDAQGFPRQDLNFGQLAEYRNLKRRKAEINNDHHTLMKEI